MSIKNEFWSKAALSQSKWVQQMESENELARSLIEKLERELAESRESLRLAVKSADLADAAIDAVRKELAAEKMLSDRLIVAGANALQGYHRHDKGLSDAWDIACAAYRKARGLL